MNGVIPSKTQADFHGNILNSREVAGFKFREIVHATPVTIPQHAHERAHVAFVIDGVFAEKCERKILECKPLSVSFLAPGTTHSDDFRNRVHCFLFEIAPQRFERVRELMKLDEPIFLHGGLVAWLTMRLLGEARRTDEASSLATEGLALEILAELTRQRVSISERKPPCWLVRAKELLHAKFAETLTHDQIAELVGVHPVHLATAFRQHYRCTIGEYIRKLRIEFASLQMATSKAPLSDIAVAAGFSDQSHFSKIFKQLTGMTPGQFRANLRQP